MLPRLTLLVALALALAIVFQAPSGPTEAQESSSLNLTVRNLTGSQPLTPPIAVVHEPGATLLPESAEDLDGLEALAEAGEQQTLAAALQEISGVKSVIRFDPPPILPGQQSTISIPASTGDHVSVISMLACTNDAIAFGTVVIHESGTLPAMSSGQVFDAGTEDNDESEATVACFGMPGGGVSSPDTSDGEGTISVHAGIGGEADLTSAHGWSGPAMDLIVTADADNVPETLKFGITLENLTAGQPITPPVVVVHDTEINVFEYNRPTELDGIDDLAEGGAQADLLATLNGTPGVVRVYGLDSGGPIVPGASYTEDMLYGVEGAKVSLVAMLACTNDGYIRVSETLNVLRGSLVPTGPTSALVFDSGSEDNDETTDTVPCLGGGPAALSEGFGEGVRMPHTGIVGGADLNVETHGWPEGEVASLWVHGPVTDDSLDLDVTVRNVTSGQPITPPVVIVHTGTLISPPFNASVVSGLETLAESGDPSAFAAGIADAPGVKSATIMDVPGPIPGGEEAVARNVAAAPGDYVSVVGMLACTNDAIAYGTVAIPAHGATPAMSSGAVYDAGTEDNDETRATVPCLGGEGVSDAGGEGLTALHTGIGGSADLSRDSHGWDGPAIEVLVTTAGVEAPAAVDFGLTLENLTDGQPITPPVAVVHDPNVDVFDYTSPTQLDGIDDLSEGGVQDDLLATLSVMPGVVRAYALDSGGPILPGTSYTERLLSGIEGANVSVVGMFACTNDAYVRATQTLTVIGGDLFPALPAIALVIDSGAEDNDERFASVPCLGGAPAALSEGLGEGGRSVHSGISGRADLSRETHGWDSEATALLFIHGPGKEQEAEAQPAPTPTPTPAATPVPETTPASLPATGDYSASGTPVLLVGLLGVFIVLVGAATIIGQRRRSKSAARIQ